MVDFFAAMRWIRPPLESISSTTCPFRRIQPADHSNFRISRDLPGFSLATADGAAPAHIYFDPEWRKPAPAPGGRAKYLSANQLLATRALPGVIPRYQPVGRSGWNPAHGLAPK